MQAVITLNILEPSPVLKISASEYDLLATARSMLVDALAFEQRFELAMSNWVEYEVACTEFSLQSKVHGWRANPYQTGFEVFSSIDRRIKNLLSSTRAYIDGVKHDFAGPELDPPFSERAASRFRSAYDDAFAYRFCEALRNAVQHRGQAVHSSKAATIGGNAHWSEALVLLASKEVLGEDPKFKKSVLAEMSGDVDVRRALREYMTALSKVHIELRIIASQAIHEARSSIEGVIKRYMELEPRTCVGLHAYRSSDRSGQSVLLMLDWDDVRAGLALKNDRPISL